MNSKTRQKPLEPCTRPLEFLPALARLVLSFVCVYFTPVAQERSIEKCVRLSCFFVSRPRLTLSIELYFDVFSQKRDTITVKANHQTANVRLVEWKWFLSISVSWSVDRPLCAICNFFFKFILIKIALRVLRLC